MNTDEFWENVDSVLRAVIAIAFNAGVRHEKEHTDYEKLIKEIDLMVKAAVKTLKEEGST